MKYGLRKYYLRTTTLSNQDLLHHLSVINKPDTYIYIYVGLQSVRLYALVIDHPIGTIPS